MRSFLRIYRFHFLLLAITSVSCLSVQAQDYLLHKKTNVEKRLSKYGSRNNERAFVYATDSTLRLSVQDSTKRKMDITCFFDAKGSCYKETKTTDCDECFQKYLNEVLYRKVIYFLLFVKCLFLLSFSTLFFLFFVAQLYFFTYICCPVVAQLAILLPTYQFDGSQAK